MRNAFVSVGSSWAFCEHDPICIFSQPIHRVFSLGLRLIRHTPCFWTQTHLFVIIVAITITIVTILVKCSSSEHSKLDKTSAPVASWSKLVKCSNSKLIAKCYRSLSTLLRTSSHILTGLPTERAPLLSIEKWAGPAEYEGASSSSSEKCSHFKKTSLLLLLLWTGSRHISEEASEKVLEKSLAFLQNTIGKHQSNWFLKFISFCV